MSDKLDKLGKRLAETFWLHNAAVKDADGNVRIVGRTSRDQEPPLDEHGHFRKRRLPK